MADPATPTPADRKATRELAAAVLESVRADARMPLPMSEMYDGTHMRRDIEALVFVMAQEIEALVKERDEAIKLAAKAMTGGNITRSDTGRMSALCKLIGHEP